MNDEDPVPRVPDNFAASNDSRSCGWSLLSELERERFLRVDPRMSRLWPASPPMLKRDLVYGYIEPDSFWEQLRRWIEFEERCERGRAA